MKDEVRSFWTANPLGTLDLDAQVGTREFFEAHEKMLEADALKYSRPRFRFDGLVGKQVLDVGCGPGILLRNYARGGARITGIDLTHTAARIAHTSLREFELPGCVSVADAECIPFSDDTFDFVCCCGVLHHTPDTQQGFNEIYRVMKPGARAVIALYYRNALLRPGAWRFAHALYNLLGVRPRGRDGMSQAKSVEDFVRGWDGDGNPLGKVYSREQALALCGAFSVEGTYLHFFPLRFMPFGRWVPDVVHHALDRTLGMMIYLELKKPDPCPAPPTDR